jgi:large subunit ribosomal protein L10
VTLPTQAKVDRVEELKDKLERCSIAVSTNYAGIGVNDITDLRRRMRDAGVEFTVVKNNLMKLACDASQRPQAKTMVEGPTAIAFGYDDPSVVPKALAEYIRTTRLPLDIQGAIMGEGAVLPPSDVTRMATLPDKSQLLASLLGQMLAPLQGLLGIMNGPVRSLSGLMQARIQQLEEADSGE